MKKLGRPATTSHLGDWNRETARISTDIEEVEIQVHSAAGRGGPNLHRRARQDARRRCRLSHLRDHQACRFCGHAARPGGLAHNAFPPSFYTEAMNPRPPTNSRRTRRPRHPAPVETHGALCHPHNRGLRRRDERLGPITPERNILPAGIHHREDCSLRRPDRLSHLCNHSQIIT